jgi:hypothetical protein
MGISANNTSIINDNLELEIINLVLSTGGVITVYDNLFQGEVAGYASGLYSPLGPPTRGMNRFSFSTDENSKYV